MALAGVHVYVSIDVLAVTMDDVFMSEYAVLLKRFMRPKAVGIDGQRLLVAVSQQESDRRFISGFRWDHVPLTSAAISYYKSRWLVIIICSTPACGQATRSRRLVALAAFESGFHLQFVDFNRAFKMWQRRIQHP